MKNFGVIFFVCIAMLSNTVLVKSENVSKPTKRKAGMVDKIGAKTSIKKDQNQIMIDAAIKAVQKLTIKSYARWNYGLIDSIRISKKYPLIVTVEHVTTPEANDVEKYVDFGVVENYLVKTLPKATIKCIGNVETRFVPQNLSTNAEAGVFYQITNKTVEILSGELELTSAFIVNGKFIYFENAKITFIDNAGTGKISEGSVCFIDGEKYKQSQGHWIRSSEG
jgi:hypothetical protein